MPWCDSCDVYLAPNTVGTDGCCPTCDATVDAADLKSPPVAKVPWHFWVVVVALVLYLGWRFIAGIVWLLERF
ncbi:MAG: hypothetical protein AAF531_22760 [Actinomycetota bacterium]